MNKILFKSLIALVFLFSSNIYPQTKFFQDKGLVVFDYTSTGIIYGGIQSIDLSKAKIVRSKSWGDSFFYVIWATTATIPGYLPSSQPNATGLPNANIFATKMVKNGNSYISNFGGYSLIRITDRYDQAKDLEVYPYEDGFFISYTTSSPNTLSAGFVQIFNGNAEPKIDSTGDVEGGGGNKSWKIVNFSTHTPVVFNKEYFYYLEFNNITNIIWCHIEPQGLPSCVGDNINIPDAINIVSGFIVPSDDVQYSSGVLVGLQANWDGDANYNIKIKRVSPDYYWSGSQGWVSVTNSNGVYVGPNGGIVRAFSEEDGPTYILWLDTATTNTGVKLAVFEGNAPTHISSNSGSGYHLATVDISSMSVNLADNYFYANNGKLGLIYFNNEGKKLKVFQFGQNGVTDIFQEKSISESDFNPKNHFFAINSSGYVGLFKRELSGVQSDGGSLYFTAFKDNGDEIFPYTLILSSSSSNNEVYSFVNVVDIGNNFSILQHEKKGTDPNASYNLFLQIVSTSVPPLDPLQNLNISKIGSDPLSVNISITDPNNIENSTYILQISTSSDFSTVIYSTNILNNTVNNPKLIYNNLTGLTHGLIYYFRVKLIYQNRETDWITSSFSDGTEMSHLSDLGIGKWSNIRNTFIPLMPYEVVNMNILDAGNNQSFYFWSNYSYSNDTVSIKVAKFDVNGSKVFEKDLVTGIKYGVETDNKFGVISDNSGGFVLLWTYIEDNNNYAKIARFNSNAELIWQTPKQINDGQAIFGVDSKIYLIENLVYVLYANNSGQVYYDMFDLSNGNRTTLNLGFSASDNFFVSTTKTSDNSIVIFYGQSSSGSLNAKKINSNGVQATESYSITNITDEDLFTISDNSGGVYFVYLDVSDNKLKIMRTDSTLNMITGYPKDIDSIYNPGWYIYHAGYTPYGPVISYRSGNQKTKTKFWSNSSNDVYQTYEHDYGFNRLSIAYNSSKDVVSVAGVVNNNGKDNVYITQYKANNAQLEYGPLAGVKNLYGLLINYPMEMVLTSVDDYFVLGHIFSENSYIQLISTYATLNVPTNLNAESITKNSITLNWTENNDNVTAWYIRYSTNSEFYSHTTTITYITQSPPYQISGLAANTTYYFAVRSSSASVLSDYSQIYAKSTLADVPTNLSVQSRNSNSLTFSWYSNGNGPGTLYNIVLLTSSNSEVSSSTETQLSKTFQGLSSNTTYYAKVRAIGNNLDITDYTPLIEAKTLITLDDIEGINFSDVTNSSIKVSFDHPSGAKSYQIEASSVSSFNISSIIITSNTVNKYAVFGTGGEGTLLPNTTYYFRVKAYYDNEEDGYANLGSKSTDPSEPTSIQITQISKNSAVVSWSSNSNPSNTLYNIVVIKDSDMSQVFSSTISLTNVTISDLISNTTYFVKIKSIGNQSESSYVSSSLFRTKVDLTGLSNVSFSDVTNNSITVSWQDTSPGDIIYQVWYAIDPTDLLYSSETLNKHATFSVPQYTLGPNTTYYLFLKACNRYDQSDCSQLQQLGSTVTHANTPIGFSLMSIYATSATFSWNINSNPQDTLYRIRYVSSNHTGNTYFNGNTATVTGLKSETTYDFYLAAINHAGVATDELELTGTTDKLLESVAQIGPGGGVVVFDTGSGEVKLNVPQGAFGSNVTVTIKLPQNPPSSSTSLLADALLTNIFVEINISGGFQPNKPTELVIEYPSNIAFSPDTLTISRYDETRSVWIPYKSYVDKTNRKVKAYVDHFSVFGLLSVTPAQNILEPKVAPNPLRPSKGAGYSTMTFSNLPQDTEVIIYNIAGKKIRHLTTDSSGIAVWDGKNDDGGEVSTGVYYVLIKKGSSTKTIKVAVQR